MAGGIKPMNAAIETDDTIIQRKNILNSNVNLDGSNIGGVAAVSGGDAVPPIMAMNNNNNADFLDLLGLDLTATGTTSTGVMHSSHSNILDGLGNGGGNVRSGGMTAPGDYNHLINNPTAASINLLNANGGNDLNSILMDASNINASVNVTLQNSNIVNASPASAVCVQPAVATSLEGSRNNNHNNNNNGGTNNAIASDRVSKSFLILQSIPFHRALIDV